MENKPESALVFPGGAYRIATFHLGAYLHTIKILSIDKK